MRTLLRKSTVGLSIAIAAVVLIAPVSAASPAETKPTSGGYFCWRLYNNLPITLDLNAYNHPGVAEQAARCLGETEEGSS